RPHRRIGQAPPSRPWDHCIAGRRAPGSTQETSPMPTATSDAIVETMNTDPYVQQLLQAPIPARLAYTGLDGNPRVVPVAYLWDGAAFVVASPPDWYKVRAIAANPTVAL